MRAWSTPIHRWLSSCILRPLVSPRTRHVEVVAGPDEGLISKAVASSSGATKLGSGGNGMPERSWGGGASSEMEVHEGIASLRPRSLPKGQLLAVFSVFIVSIVLHEAVFFVAFRATYWPIMTFLLVPSAIAVATWEKFFPRTLKQSSSVGVDRTGSRRAVSQAGARGPVATLIFTFSNQSGIFMSHYLGWLLWRRVFVADGDKLASAS